MDLNPLTKLARKVRAASDDMAEPGPTLDGARRRALEGWQRRRPGSRRPLVIALVAAALFAALFLLLPKRPAITYVVGTEPGRLGAWIAVGPEQMPVRFSEGSVVTLASGARARVTRADADGAAVLLERGSARASVAHKGPSTRWDVQVGPFEIAVVGTEFDVAWDPTRETLELRMIEGKVLVKGPMLGDGRALAQGERLRVEVGAQRSEVTASPVQAGGDASSTPVEEPPAVLVVPAPAAPAAVPSAVLVAPSPSEGHRDGPAWRALAAEGRHREAMAAIEREGFERVLAAVPAPLLLDLADEARFAGQPVRARQALMRARELGARGRSAFLLGKIAADHENAPAEALGWFERYLDEVPKGSLAEQALGRVIELRRRLGDAAGARATAKLYLHRHPDGAYASLARAAAGP